MSRLAHLRGYRAAVTANGDARVHRIDAAPADENRIATIPNVLSFARILLIPVFVLLILREGTEAAGLILALAVVSTDWIDGYLARRLGQVSNLGKLLDPVADRLALAAAIIALVLRDAFPLWAALLVLVRDALILLVGAVLLVRHRIRIDVRWIGKAATFWLMCGFPLIAWGNFGLPLRDAALMGGWVLYAMGITAYYLAAAAYVADLRAALASGAHR